MAKRFRTALVAGVSLNVIGALGVAWAGDTAATGAVATARTVAVPAAETAASTDAAPIQEVVVTAQHRNESIQKVPMTVQAFTTQTLSQLNIATLDDLLKYTPNVTFASNGPGQGDIFMRGLSSGFRGNQSSATVSDFPNVAIYLDEQSMQFPARNVDIYMVDMERVEVLEGPQGTLFGGGAEAGAVRYITNKPKIGVFEGNVNAGYGWTEHGGDNNKVNATVNAPIGDKIAIRAVVYDEVQGGYITNEPSTFTRSNADPGNNSYFNLKPTGGACPNGKPAYTGAPYSVASPLNCTLPGTPTANNYGLASKDSNPTEYYGGRLSGLFELNNDWNALISASYSGLHADGLSAEYPTGSDFQPLGQLENTTFSPTYTHDRYTNVAWTLNGKVGPLKLIYTGGWTDRHIVEQQDYTNYSRSGGGLEYECTGPNTSYTATGITKTQCYSPIAYWHDQVTSTHLSNEVRLSSPDTWRLRFLVGAYLEQFRSYDVMNFSYKTVPDCSPANLAEATAPGNTSFVCLANIGPAPGATTNDPNLRGNNVGFGEDTQRGYDQTAFFGSVDFDIIPKVLTITGGTRYYDYSEFEVGSQYNMSGAAVDVPNGDCGSGCYVNINSHNDHVHYRGFKSRAGITWTPTSNLTFYYLFSQGFRPGGFNRSNSKEVLKDPTTGQNQYLEPNSYAPDSLTNNEIGMKAQFFNRRLQINLSAYDMDWDNVQFFLFAPVYSINTTFGLNGPNYNIKGLEAQVIGRVVDGLTIQGSASYNNAQVTKAPCLVDNVAGTPSFGQCITMAVQKSSGQTVFDNPFGGVGQAPAFSPDFQGNIRLQYDWTVMGSYRAHFMIGGNYVSQMYNQPGSYESGVGIAVPTTTYLRYAQPGYGTMDASISIGKDNWTAKLYGTNLLDSHASTFTSSAEFIKSEVPLRPTVIMTEIGYKF